MYIKNISRILLFFLITLIGNFLLSISCFAQSNQVFSNIKIKDGLPSSSVMSVAQDSIGFMWFATNRGLVRYDGYEVQAFRNNRASDINFGNSAIGVIEKAGGDGLWAGSTAGLLYFDTSTGENSRVDLGGDRDIRCLLNQGDSVLWVGSTEGLFKVNVLDKSFQLFNQQNSLLSSNTIRSLYLSRSEELWVGTFNGLNRLKSGKLIEVYNFKNNYKPELENNLILDIQAYSATSDSLLWVGTETGLVLFNSEKGTYEVFNSQNTNILNEVVKCVHSKIPGQVFFGTDLGFYKYDVRTKEVSSSFHDPFNQYSIANNIVYDIYEDKNEVLWLTTANGISKLNFQQNKFQFTPVYNQHEKQIIGTQVNNIYKDNNGAVWLATAHGVKVIYPDGHIEVFTAESHPNRRIVLNSVSSITGDKLGRIWIGTAGGINVWDPKTKEMFTFTADFNQNTGLRTNYIASFITPYDGSLWVTTWGGGIYKAQGDFSNVDDITFRFIADFNSGVFTANKKIWIFENQKMFALDIVTNEVGTFESLSEHLKDKGIASIHISKRGELWIGTNDLLIKYETQSGEVHEFPVITGKSSMLDNLVEDQHGNIWGTTLTSIFKFNARKNIFETYPKNEEIALDNFIPYSKDVAEDGQLFFGGDDGFVSFYADEIRKSDFQPNLLITDLTVGGEDIHSLNEIGRKNKTFKHISFFDKIILAHDQNSFQLQFSSLDLAQPERNIYAYKLDGFDNDWIYTSGDRNYAAYTNIPRGNYSFIVKATNNDGVWLEEEKMLEVIIKPPIWASTLAIIFYFLILIGAVVLLIATYRNKIKWEEEIRLIKVDKEKNEEIALSKQRLFTNVSHEFRTPLTLILGPVNQLINKAQLSHADNQLLSLIQKNGQRLLSLVNQLLDLRKVETNTLRLEHERFNVIDACQKQYELFIDLAENNQINYRFKASRQSVSIESDKVRFESIIQNLLSNAFKFTPLQGEIEFEVDVHNESQIKIVISDTGIGISNENKEQIFKRFYQGDSNSTKSSGYGIGLNIIKEYCELMKGKIWFESEQGKGTSFFVELPIQIIESEDKLGASKAEQTMVPKEEAEQNQTFENKNLPMLLLVDDNADTLEYLQLSLKEDYNIVLASNGKKAFEKLKQHKIDLVVSDIMMDELDGIEFCQKVKQHPKYESVPMILLTAKTMDTQKVEGYQAGADAYMTKPFNMDVLKTQISNLLARNKRVDDYIQQKLIISNQETKVESADEKLLKETVQYINANLTNTEINLEDMAHAIGVSYSSLYRKIKSQTGLRLNELVRSVRLKKAEQLLKTEKFTISEIIFETGFSSHSYFAKCFKKEFGVAPKEYLQSNK